MSPTHKAAVLPRKGGPLSLAPRATPIPGPNEILIQVKAIAVNPIDHYQRDLGFPPIPVYPAVLGFDVAGLVAGVGSAVLENAFPLGSRVIAYATSFFQDGNPDYGAFQEYVLAPSELISALPDRISFEQGTILPVAWATALTGWTTIGIPLETRYSQAEREAALIWGGSSSVGSLAIQSAKIMGFTVYTTASTANHEYLLTLGADAVFDYRDADVVTQIVAKAEHDGVILKTAQCIVDGGLQPTLDVLKQTAGDTSLIRIAHAPVLPPDAPTLEGAMIKFNYPPLEAKERNEHYFRCFHEMLAKELKEGTVVPSPRIHKVEGGLGGLNDALDLLKKGVSGTKVVISI